MPRLNAIIARTNGGRKSKEISDLNSTDMESSSTHTRISTSWEPYRQTIQNFRLVWLDNSFDEINNDDFIHTMTQLRQIVDTIQKSSDIDECVDFITDIEDEKIFMICSEEFGQTITSVIHNIAQINCVYILCKNTVPDEQWVKDWSTAGGVYTDITSICKALTQAARFCDQNTVSLSFLKSTDETSKQNLDQLDQSFMYTQLLKEILLTIEFEQDHTNEFPMYCREQLAGNIAEFNNIDKFEKEYHHHPTIWWYTYNCFLYSMLNRALRLMEVDLIIKMGFFLQDLHNHIAALHSQQYSEQNQSNSFIVVKVCL